jgi:hypothetical protein
MALPVCCTCVASSDHDGRRLRWHAEGLTKSGEYDTLRCTSEPTANLDQRLGTTMHCCGRLQSTSRFVIVSHDQRTGYADRVMAKMDTHRDGSNGDRSGLYVSEKATAE